MTALYIRTVPNKTLSEPNGRWKLPEDIDEEKGIALMEDYAETHGYKDPVIFLDNGYDGTGGIKPAYLFMQQIMQHTTLIDTVIISDLHQVDGGMNVLMLMDELFTKCGVKFVIAAFDEEARSVIDRCYDEWVEEEVLDSVKNADKDEGVPFDEALNRVRDYVKAQRQQLKEDIRNATEQPEKFSAKGTRIVNAEEARWHMKRKAVKKLKEAFIL